jgi:hypothetical protein
MSVRALDAPPSSPVEEAKLRDAATALLRWRAHWLVHNLPIRQSLAAQLFPVLIHASFERPRLGGDPPGVSGMRYRRGWSILARTFGLPPPCRAQRGTCIADGVIGILTRTGIDMLVLVPKGLRPEDLGALQERLEAAQALFKAEGIEIQPAIFDVARLERDQEVGFRAIAFGALLAGRIPAPAWAALEATNRDGLARETLAAMAAAAPTELAMLSLILMTSVPIMKPLQALGVLAARGQSARVLSDPSVFAVRWAGLGRLDEPLEKALRLRPRPKRPALSPAAKQPRRPLRAVEAVVEEPVEAHEILQLGRDLALAFSRAAKALGKGFSRRRVWHHVLGPGIPRALLPALTDRLTLLARQGQLDLAPVPAGSAFEVRLPDGTVLGHGATPVQARVRALALAAGTGNEEILSRIDPVWRVVAERLSRPADRPTVLMLVEPSTVSSGPPLDPLNRGPGRELAFAAALALDMAPGRRPSGRILSPEAAIRHLIRATMGGAALEVVASRPEARGAAARLVQLGALISNDQAAVAPLALEAGGKVFFPGPRRLRRYGLRGFLSRPRAFTPDPESPDLSMASGERSTLRWNSAGIIECRVALIDERTASVLYADSAGGHLREEIPVASLERHLRESRAILQAADPAAILALRLSEDVEPAVRRVNATGTPVTLSVRGSLPFDLEIAVSGASYGRNLGQGWRAAAQAVVAEWRSGTQGHLAVKAVSVRAGGTAAKGLLALYARSLAQRRLWVHIARELRAYQPGK